MECQGRILNVAWLLREGAAARAMQVGERTVVDTASLSAVIECIDAGASLRVYLTDATAHKDVTVEPRAERTEPWIGSQTTVTGQAQVDFLDGPRAQASARNALLFRACARAAAYTLSAGAHFRSVGYGMDIARVERLFDGAPPAGLRPLLASNMTASRVIAMRPNRQMRALAESLFAPNLNGPLRVLMMEGAVIQLLALHAAALHKDDTGLGPATPIALTRREQQKVREARERLLADMCNPPSLGTLATQVGLSEKKLNAGFRAQFGATVFETLRNERLEHARLALEEGALALEEVARRVGYNHVTNFITAFSARYGASPRRYLRTS